MELRQAKSLIGGSLSQPSKMPGWAWNIPASRCILGAKLAQIEGSTCSSCYAKKGRYVFPSTKTAMERRFQAMQRPEWVDAMVVVLSSEAVRNKGYFRWFDSGDLQSVQHLKNICEIARRTPFLKHWMPTREQGFLKRFMETDGDVPANLTIRLSAPMIGGNAATWWPWTSKVHVGHDAPKQSCPAQQQGNECGDCRRCWDRRVKVVSYPRH